MRMIYCCEPFAPSKSDPVYLTESQASLSAGLPFDLIDFEALTDDHNPKAAVKRIKHREAPESAIYRGWMLAPTQYSQLYEALAERGLSLINAPDQYKHCHYLPESYPIIKYLTPQTVFIPYDAEFGFDKLMNALALFGDKPLILKDYVKSRKHEWYEACFIPTASDQEAVRRVVNRFIELQSDQINEGLAFREYVEFESLTIHSKSGMPLTKEFRLFFFDGEPFYAIQYWDEGDYGEFDAPMELFKDVARNVKSRFFTMDIAKRTDGDWMIVELGDGQVAGLPEKADAAKFYSALKDRLADMGID